MLPIPKFTFEQKLALFFAALFLGLTTIAYVVYKNNMRYIESAEWVRHTQQVLVESEKILSEAEAIQTGARGYVIAQDSDFLHPLVSGERNAYIHIEKLKVLVQDNPEQLARIDTLEAALQVKAAFMYRYIQLVNSGKRELAIKQISTKEGKRQMDRIRDLIFEIQNEESALLQKRQDASVKSLVGLKQTFLVFLSGLMILLVIIYFTIRSAFEERKRTEEAIRQTNSFLDTILENIPNMIFVKDAKHLRFVRFNKAGEKLLGQPKETLLGKSDYDFFPKEQADFFTAKDREVLHRNELADIAEEPIETPAGRRLLHTQKLPITGADGKPAYLMGISEDITEKKEAEELLKDSERQVQTIFAAAPDAIIVIDEEGRVLRWNAQAETLFGWSYEEVAGQKLVETIIPHEYRQMHNKGMEHFLRTGYGPVLNKTIELTALRKNGTEFFVELTISHTQLKGKYIFIGFLKDISERKEAEQQLRDSERQIQTIFASAPDAIIVLDDKGVVIRWNTQAEILYGWTAGEMTGQPLPYTILPEKYRETLRKILADYANPQAGQTVDKTIEIPTQRKDGTVFIAELTISQTQLKGKTIYIGFLKDITERKKKDERIRHLNNTLENTVEQLQLANKEMEAFTYSVSHDLRAPLRIMNGFSEMMLADYADKLDEEGKNNLRVIMSNSRHMGQLIDDLLNLSRLGRAALDIKPVDMNEIVNDVVDSMKFANTNPGLEINRQTLPSVVCDPSLVKQVWTNLISNADKYSRKKDKQVIEIGSLQKDGQVVYYIKDNGVGFDMQYSSKLFGVFQRLHKISEFEGTGVGLAIVHRIINKHGGKIWAEGKENEGAIFYFTLS